MRTKTKFKRSNKQHLILRYFHRIDAHSVVNAQFLIAVNSIIGFLIGNQMYQSQACATLSIHSKWTKAQCS